MGCSRGPCHDCEEFECVEPRVLLLLWFGGTVCYEGGFGVTRSASQPSAQMKSKVQRCSVK
jgi:hypothetical protein